MLLSVQLISGEPKPSHLNQQAHERTHIARVFRCWLFLLLKSILERAFIAIENR